jgi:hypothetical protein
LNYFSFRSLEHFVNFWFFVWQQLFFASTVKTGVLFRHLLRHRNSASASVISTFKSVCLRVKTTLISVEMRLLIVKITLLSVESGNDTASVVSTLKSICLSVETTLRLSY